MSPRQPRPFSVRTTPPILYRETPDGVLVYLDPTFVTAPPAKSITAMCLVQGPDGWPVGIAAFEEHADGRARCVVTGFCASDCGEASVPPPPPAACVTVSGTVKLQPEDLGVFTGLDLVAYGTFSTTITGTYSVGLPFASATVGFGCAVPTSETPRDVYYSLDAGATWTLAGSGASGAFSLALPETCEPVEVLWELWESGGGGPGAVAGTVFDSLGMTGLSGRVITLTGANTGSATTDGSGNYSFTGLAYGTTTATITLGSESAEYKLDGGSWTVGAAPVVSVAGTHDLDYRVSPAAPPPSPPIPPPPPPP